MMENQKRATVWIVIAVLAGLLLGCLGGTLFGGLGGYALGRSSAPTPFTPPLREFRIEPTPGLPAPPEPVRPDTPATPAAPLLQGVALITQVVPDSPAESAGIQVGDMITAVDGMSLEEASLAELIGEHRPGDMITLSIWRAGRERELTVELGEHPERSGVAWIGVYYHEVQR
jgi:membrane-associated protease RseP (regulator of RpoE activity)